MKLYRCELCGRVFDKMIPHQCSKNQYRKHNIVFTEFEDVEYEYIKKPESDVKEESFPEVNWEQMRAKAAISAMSGILANPDLNLNFETDEDGVVVGVTRVSVKIADALIAELKKE